MFRLVLTDIQMPKMDGFEFAKQVINHQRGWKAHIEKTHVFGKTKMKRECPVVAVTAHVN